MTSVHALIFTKLYIRFDSGGGGALPFVHTLVRQMFAHAIFPINRYDSVELGSAGAAIHGGTAALSQVCVLPLLFHHIYVCISIHRL